MKEESTGRIYSWQRPAPEPWCRECEAWHPVGRCRPKWQCWCVDWDGEDFDADEAMPVRAIDAQHAAERFIEQHLGEVNDGDILTVLVKPEGYGEPTRVGISVKLTITLEAVDAPEAASFLPSEMPPEAS